MAGRSLSSVRDHLRPSRLTRASLVAALWSLVGLAAVVIVLVELASTRRPFGFSLAAALTNGLSIGSVYALVALGVALVYRATRVINFAQGELGTLPAFLVLTLLLWRQSARTGAEGGLLDAEIDAASVVDWEFAVFVLAAIAFGALLAIGINLLVVRRLANVSPVTSLVATTGIALAATSIEVIVFKARDRSFPRLIEGAPGGIKLGPFCLSQLDGQGACSADGRLAFGGEVVTWNTVLIFGLLIGVSLALAAFFQSRAGVALLATAQEPFAASLYGVPPAVMSSIAWGIAGGFAGLAGILGAGFFTSLRPGYITTLFLVPALVAAVLGGLTSMVGAVVGGLLVGVISALANSVILQLGLNATIPGPPTLATFAALVLVLVLRPRGLFGKDA